MRTKKIVFALILLSALLLLTACAGTDAKPEGKSEAVTDAEVQQAAEVDLFEQKLSVKVEHTFKEGDSHYLLALFPDGKTGMYQAAKPSELPVIRDLETGRSTKITLSEFHSEDIEFMFRSAVILQAKRYTDDTSKLEEKLSSVHGLDLFKSYPNAITMRVPAYCLTSAKSDLLCLQDYNTQVGGMFDPNTGVLYNNFRDENGTFEPVSAFGTKVLGRYANSAAILDLNDFSFTPLDLTGALGCSPKWHGCTALGYLADGSIAAIVSANDVSGGTAKSEYLLGILREDGGTETYELGGSRGSFGSFTIVSNDPDCVIAMSNQPNDASRLVNRKTGEVTLLKIKGKRIASAALDDAEKLENDEIVLSFVDVLDDGRTIIARDGNTGSLALFRPDTMETKMLVTDGDVTNCMYFSGDHHGRLCATYMKRGENTEHGILITIVDKNGDPIGK